MENICIFPFFGELKSTCIASTLLLNRMRQEMKSSKYFILCSWPENSGIFPYIDEYWCPEDLSILKGLYNKSNGFANDSEYYLTMQRNLHYFFEDVITPDILKSFYQNGLTDDYFARFSQIKVTFPEIPSSNFISTDISQQLNQKAGRKIFIFPSNVIYSWRNGQDKKINCSKEFWHALVENLHTNGYTPVIWINYNSLDISGLAPDKGIYFNSANILDVLTIMRLCDCVLDVHNGISNLALLARSPYFCLDERSRFNNAKQFEINALLGQNTPINYSFSFSSILENKDAWQENVFSLISARLESFLANIDYKQLADPKESTNVVSYDLVKDRKAKKLGVKFVKIPRISV